MNAQTSILVCDHRGEGLDPMLGELLTSGGRVERAESLRASLAAIERQRPGLIILCPLVEGGRVELEALEHARVGDPPVPLLLVAERENSAGALLAAEALRSPAWDLIYTDTPPLEVLLRARRLVREAETLAEMGELRYHAWHDDRTDLLRAKAFENRLEEHFSAAHRHHLDMALVLIDLDDFGKVNKEHDHTVGDILITQVGEVIRRTLRAEDVAGRLGGDEFAVLLPYTRKVDAARVVSRLREEIHKLSGRPAGAQSDLVVSASLGFETCDGSDLDSVQTLRRHAEQALRRAKLAGGNRGIYFRSEVPASILELEQERGDLKPAPEGAIGEPES